MSPQRPVSRRDVDEAVASALRRYRAARTRHGVLGADGWLLGYLNSRAGEPDVILAAVVRAVLGVRAGV